MQKILLTLIAAFVAASAAAELMDRPGGIRIGQRLVIRPYVALSVAYDTNVTSCNEEEDDVVWNVNPGFNFQYSADKFYLKGTAYYAYNAYTKDHGYRASDYHNYGQTLTFGWDTAPKTERGWSLIVTEGYRKINRTDDITLSDGSTYGRDSQQFNFSGILERRITERLHANVSAGYYWLDYDNSNNRGSLYGWSRWTAATEIGYVTSKWFNLLVYASYQDYTQDNAPVGGRFSRDSKGATFHVGFGSYATDRISYRLLMGWTRFEYAGGMDDADGLTYSASCRWRIGETWNLTFLAASYYQPSEREYATAQRTDSVSFGVAKSLIRSKLNATFDVAYRHEGHTYSYLSSRDYDLDILTFRLGLNYMLNRYLSVFARGEYRDSMSDKNSYYDYERLRATLGLRLTY
ncbi:MAG: outer membrane beta-barrel protein [Kiritimatiellae bacterium]|nr:outer membrane beta-barrel protein [Kiritimatiellia bacterium]